MLKLIDMGLFLYVLHSGFLLRRDFSAFDICLHHGREGFVACTRRALQKLAEACGCFIIGFADIKTKLCDGSIILDANGAIIFETTRDILLNRVIMKWLPIDNLIEKISA